MNHLPTESSADIAMQDATMQQRQQRRSKHTKRETNKLRRIELRRQSTIEHHRSTMAETQHLLETSEQLFKERRWDETAFLQIPNQGDEDDLDLDHEDDQDHGSQAHDHGSAAAHHRAEQEEFELSHFAFRKNNIELKITELNNKFQRLAPRTTVEFELELESGGGGNVGDDTLTQHPSENLAADSSLWTVTDPNDRYSSLVGGTNMISLPKRVGVHVTMSTAAHLQLEAPMSNKNDFVLPDPNAGPRMLSSALPRRSLDARLAQRTAGSVSRPGGQTVPRPNRYTSHVTSMLTETQHMTFLPPLYGDTKVTSSTSHEERARIMEKQMRNAAARRIQRMWSNRVGIMVLIQKIKQRKKRAKEDAERLRKEIAEDKIQAARMFARPAWASFDTSAMQQKKGKKKKKVKKVKKVKMEEEKQQQQSEGSDQEQDPRQELQSPSSSPLSPFHKSFKAYRNFRHVAHTLTLHPRHTMSGREWRILNKECYMIVFHDAEDKKPAFTKKTMRKWLTRLYKTYALAPEHMTIGYNERAAEYWGKVDVEKFARATHFEPFENVVKILQVMAQGSRSKGEEEREGGGEESATIMLFPVFARSLVKLCCLSTVDLVSFFVFVVNEDREIGAVATTAVGGGDEGRGTEEEEKEKKIGERQPEEKDAEEKEAEEKDAEEKDLEDGLEKEEQEEQQEEKQQEEKQQEEKQQEEQREEEEEEEEEETLGVTQRRLEKLLCQIHRGHGNADDLLDSDFVEGPSGYSWAVDLEDMSGIVHRSLSELNSVDSVDSKKTKRRDATTTTRTLLGPSDLLKLLLRCPIFSYPCLYMQRCLRRRIFGERFWSEFDMCHFRVGLPKELVTLSKQVERQKFHFMTLRHAWAETTRYILLQSLGVDTGNSDDSSGNNGGVEEVDEEVVDMHHRCVVTTCQRPIDASLSDIGLCPACEIKGVGLIADSVGIRVAQRFRERTRWFSSREQGAGSIQRHTKWLLMQDKLSKCNFYFNGETAASRWNLNPRLLKMENNGVEIVDMRPKRKKRKKKRRKRE